MSSHTVSLPRRPARLPAEVAGVASALLGVLVAAGWLTRRVDLVQLVPGQVPMQFNTAVLLVLLGTALVVLLTRLARWAAVPLAVVLTGGALTLVEYVSGHSLGIDTLLFDPWLTLGTDTPGRMARNTAICMTVLGATGCWLALSRVPGRAALGAGAGGSLVAGVALVAMFGYASGVSSAYAWRTSTAMAPSTAAALLLLGIGWVAVGWGAATAAHGHPRWLPLPLGVGALAATLFLWQALVDLGADDARTISLDRAAGAVLGIGVVFAVLLALAAYLGQDARRRRADAERLAGRLEEEIAGRAAQAQTLLDRSRRDTTLRAAYVAVSSARDLREGFAAFAEAVTGALPFDRVSLSLVEGVSARIAAVAGPRAATLPVGALLPVTNPIVADLLKTQGPYHVGDTFTEFADGVPGVVRGSFAAAPIVVAGEIRATLAFAAVREGAFTPDDLTLVGELINAVGGALYTIARLGEEERTSARLRELDQLKNEFVGVVAHDLRSPMTVIAGYVDTVLQRWDDLADDMKRELLSVASKNTKRLSVLVEDVLQVARIESGEFPYEIAPFDLGALVRRTATEMTSARPARPVVADVPADLPAALGDEDRQWRVLVNLLSNAQKFSPDEVPTTVRVRAGTTHLTVEVADRGPGIPAEDVPRLFGKFSRLASAPGGEKGTGLGLYICKALVEAQGGTIDATSNVGEGTTLRYTVPRQEVAG